jgi:hypothetical protein
MQVTHQSGEATWKIHSENSEQNEIKADRYKTYS